MGLVELLKRKRTGPAIEIKYPKKPSVAKQKCPADTRSQLSKGHPVDPDQHTQVIWFGFGDCAKFVKDLEGGSVKAEENVEFEMDDGDVCDLFQNHAAVSLTVDEVQRLVQKHASYHPVPQVESFSSSYNELCVIR